MITKITALLVFMAPIVMILLSFDFILFDYYFHSLLLSLSVNIDTSLIVGNHFNLVLD